MDSGKNNSHTCGGGNREGDQFPAKVRGEEGQISRTREGDAGSQLEGTQVDESRELEGFGERSRASSGQGYSADHVLQSQKSMEVGGIEDGEVADDGTVAAAILQAMARAVRDSDVGQRSGPAQTTTSATGPPALVSRLQSGLDRGEQSEETVPGKGGEGVSRGKNVATASGGAALDLPGSDACKAVGVTECAEVEDGEEQRKRKRSCEYL